MNNQTNMTNTERTYRLAASFKGSNPKWREMLQGIMCSDRSIAGEVFSAALNATYNLDTIADLFDGDESAMDTLKYYEKQIAQEKEEQS